jgi:hypothetical protein
LTSVQPLATHESFVKHVAASFKHAFTTGDLSLEGYRAAVAREEGVEVMSVGEEVLDHEDERAEKIRKGMEEMKVCLSVLAFCVARLTSRRLGIGYLARRQSLVSL